MIILGLDPSQSTGWALYDTDQAKKDGNKPFKHMRCGVLRVKGTKGEFEANSGMLGNLLKNLIREVGVPDFAVLERAPRQPYGAPKPKKGTVKFMGIEMVAQEGDVEGGNGLQSTLSTNQMAAALSAVLGAYGIPFEALTDGEWRKLSYGFGKRPGWKRPDWKRHARQTCAMHKISVTNDDMAEACWIAYAGEFLQSFKYLEDRTAA